MHSAIQVGVYVLLLLGLAPVFAYMLRSASDDRHSWLHKIRSPLENWLYRSLRIDAKRDMGWKEYTMSVVAFNAIGGIFLFVLQELQHLLPMNPDGLGPVPFTVALNTAVSFITNTNWQAYGGETTMSHMTQVVGLTVQNFVSAATGIAVLFALIRGLRNAHNQGLGNAWTDITRITVRVLLPASVVLALLLMTQGVVQNFDTTAHATTVQGIQQSVPMGPVASQVAIKQLGTNGGGFFNANSAHPLENSTPLSNLLQMLALLVIPAGCILAYGKLIGEQRHGRILYGSMLALLVIGIGISVWSEHLPNSALGVTQSMEGKEVRFGITNSVIWSTATTAASNGSVNAMHDSMSPLAGGVAMVQMALGEVVFGGVGSGMYGLVMFVVLTVFLCGLMVGRTPEYLGKRIDSFDVRMMLVAIVLPSAAALVYGACILTTDVGRSALLNHGVHGLSGALYNAISAAGNNGSAFGGFDGTTMLTSIGSAIVMLIGRYGVIIPVMAFAGSMASKQRTPVTSGTFRTDTITFAVLTAGIILIVGALTFFPFLALGPIAEHLLMMNGVAQ